MSSELKCSVKDAQRAVIFQMRFLKIRLAWDISTWADKCQLRKPSLVTVGNSGLMAVFRTLPSRIVAHLLSLMSTCFLWQQSFPDKKVSVHFWNRTLAVRGGYGWKHRGAGAACVSWWLCCTPVLLSVWCWPVCPPGPLPGCSGVQSTLHYGLAFHGWGGELWIFVWGYPIYTYLKMPITNQNKLHPFPLGVDLVQVW